MTIGVYSGVYPPFSGGSGGSLTASLPLAITANNIAMTQASGTTSGWLSSADWNTFSSAAGGGISSLSGDVTTAAAVGGVAAATVVRINGISLAALGTGILKNTTGTGAPSIAIAADFPTLNQNTTGTSSGFTGNLAGDVTGPQGTTAIAAHAVTYAKFQQVVASSLLGNPTGSLANAQGITLGASLVFSGSSIDTVQEITTGSNVVFLGIKATSTFQFATGATTGYVMTSADNFGNAQWSALSSFGVVSAQGTANEVLINGTSGTPQNGVLVFTTPQPIGTGSSPTFTGLLIAGSSSGAVSILGQAAAGTYNFNLPITAGTVGYLLTSQGGSTNAMTWTIPSFTITAGTGLSGGGTVSLGGSTTLSIAASVPTSFTTNSGNAIPATNVLSITGGSTGLTTAGSGSVVSLTGTLVAGSGGTGLATFTTYAPICAGTTSTGNFQQATTGMSNAGWVLTSNGASALPTWQASGIAGTVTSIIQTANQISASSTTGNVTLTLPNGISIGSYQSTTPPNGGLIMPGKLGVGLASPDTGSISDFAGNINCTGWSVGGSGSNAYLIAQVFTRDNIEMFWDCYYNGTSIISNSSNGNFRFAKTSNLFEIDYASVTSGSAISFGTGITLTSAGNVGIGDAAPGSKLSVLGGLNVGFASGTVAPTNGAAISGVLLVNETSRVGVNSQFQVNGTAWNSSFTDGTNTVGIYLNTGQCGLGTFNNVGLNFFTNNGGTQLTLATNNGVAFGSYANAGNTPPAGGVIIPGISGFGTSGPFTSTQAHLAGSITTTTGFTSFPFSASATGLYLNTSVVPATGTGGMVAGIINYPSLGVATGQTMTYAFGTYSSITFPSNAGTLSNVAMHYIDDGYVRSGSFGNVYGLYVKAPTFGTYKVAGYFDNLALGFNGSNLGSIGANDLLVFGNIASGTAIPNASAQLTLVSATKGFLPPTNSAPATNISSPATGLQVHNTTLITPQFFNGSKWLSLAGFNLIASSTVTSVASASFVLSNTNSFDQYQTLFILIENFQPVVNGDFLFLQVSNNSGSTYYSTGYIGGVTSNDASAGNGWSNIAASVNVNLGVTSTGSVQFGYLYMGNFSTASSNANFTGVFHINGSQQLVSSFQASSTTGYNAFKLLCSTGNIAKMTIAIYGAYHP